MIAIIDYGMGNLRSVQKAFEFINQKSIITSDKKIISKADKIVLPGVGAFEQAIERIKSFGLDKVIYEQIERRRPFLGICLGMQLLFNSSYEGGKHNGLGILDGDIIKFQGNFKIPHVGWNDIEIKKRKLFGDLQNPMVYFTHSYFAMVNDDTSGICTYENVEFCASIEKNNIFATQFHPEKSGDIGLEILRNFVKR